MQDLLNFVGPTLEAIGIFIVKHSPIAIAISCVGPIFYVFGVEIDQRNKGLARAGFGYVVSRILRWATILAVVYLVTLFLSRTFDVFTKGQPGGWPVHWYPTFMQTVCFTALVPVLSWVLEILGRRAGQKNAVGKPGNGWFYLVKQFLRWAVIIGVPIAAAPLFFGSLGVGQIIENHYPDSLLAIFIAFAGWLTVAGLFLSWIIPKPAKTKHERELASEKGTVLLAYLIVGALFAVGALWLGNWLVGPTLGGVLAVGAVLLSFGSWLVARKDTISNAEFAQGQRDRVAAVAGIKGGARWARGSEITAHGLLGEVGVYLHHLFCRDHDEDKGSWKPGAYAGATSILTIAPSGSGKFVTAIAPTLLTSPASFIVNDPKGEAYAVTAHYRAHGLRQAVFLLDPFYVSGHPTHHYNPLTDLDTNAATFESDIAVIAGAMIVDDGGQRFFTDGARKLVAALILHVCTAPGETATLPRVNELLNLPDEDWLVLMMQLERSRFQTAQFAARPFLSKTPTRSTPEVLNTARTQLGDFLPYAQIGDVLGSSDFSMRDLKQRPMTVYVVLPQAESLRFNRFTRLLFGWAVKQLQATPANPQRLPVCLLIDEMATSIGNLEILKQQFALGRGYGYQLWGVFQDIGQMKEVFGQDGYRSVLGSSGLTQYFTPNDDATMQEIQKRGGKYTRVTSERENMQLESIEFFQQEQLYNWPKDQAILFKKELGYPVNQWRQHYREINTLNQRAQPNPYEG